ncbi:MAG: hypothetical protein V3T72_19220 [Thermoanaerobaculia bacterium]
MATLRLVRHHPEPGGFWIAASPRSWNASSGAWTDLAAGRLLGVQGRPPAALPEIGRVELDDLLYLPPVDPSLAEDRDRAAVRLLEAGTPLLVQRVPGAAGDLPAVVETVYDLAEPLLAGDLDRLRRLPAGSTAVWPLIAAVTDGTELRDRGCELLAGAGVRCVQPLAVEVDPVTRRSLAEERGDDRVFAALFHGPPPSERDFAHVAHRHGLEVFMRRPPTGFSPRRTGNRRLAAGLALAGELWLRLERPESRGQALLRAARGADAAAYDLTALVREGNLTVMDWIDDLGVGVLDELVDTGRSSLLNALLEEYLAGPAE